MIKCNNWPIAVCTWSLDNDFGRIAALREQTGLSHVHLALSPALELSGQDYLAQLSRQNLEITAAMIDFPQEDYSSLGSIRATGGIVPDECWADNKKRVIDAIDLTSQLGAKYLEFHFGFLDHANAKYAAKFCDRTKLLADAAAQKGVVLLMETGQEAADDLRRFLEDLDHSAVGVNFDPANMILYDKGEPVEAVHTLSPWIKHVHIKDALRTDKPGEWGVEMPWGDGQASGEKFLDALKQIDYSGAIAIERESGDNRLDEIKLAIKRLTRYPDRQYE